MVQSGPQLRSWLSREDWRHRIITFDPSWFVLTMGTGIIVQLLNYFPWPAIWLKDLGFAFWVLDIVLYSFFLVMGGLRLVLYPKVTLTILDDFSQTSFLGAIPISLNTITAGIIIYYSNHIAARYVAEAFFWISVVLTTLVTCGGVWVVYKRQGNIEISDVTGVWLLSFIPMIVLGALGSNLCPYLAGNNVVTVLAVSLLMLSLGLGMSFIVTTIYFWRLVSCSLPARDAIVSCFVPVGPYGMGAFAILGLSTDLAHYISTESFVFRGSGIPPISPSDVAVVAQTIVWMGVIACLALLGLATFFLIEAFASVLSKLPKTFNIGFWSFVFPLGVYANAFCRLSNLIRNNAVKGWAATCVVATILLWLFCALLTFYKAVWQGKIFVAPGLQGNAEQAKLDQDREKTGAGQHQAPSAFASGREQRDGHLARRTISPDGTYEDKPPHNNGPLPT